MTEPIVVQGPDGSEIEFPAGTPRETITRVMRGRYGGPPASPPSELQQVIGNQPLGYQGAAPDYMPQPPVESGGQKLGRILDDSVRMLANGATFGFADKLAGYAGGEGTEAERAKSDAAKARLGPYVGTGLEMAGSLGTGIGAAKAGLTLARMAPTAPGLAGTAGRVGLAATEGAGYGALSALGHDKPLGQGAGIGALAGAAGYGVGNAISAAGRKIVDAFAKSGAPKTVQEARDAASRLYNEAEQYGVVLAPQAAQRLARETTADAAQFGYHPELQPKFKAMIDALTANAGSGLPTTLKGVEVLRRIAGTVRKEGGPSEGALAKKVIDKIDDMVTNPQPGEVLMGNIGAASTATTKARDMAQRAFKAEAVQEGIETAARRTSTTGSGGNIDNAIRQEVRKVYEKGAGFTPVEKAMMEDIMSGTTGQNALRLVGKLSPQGSGLMAAMGIGGTAMNPAVAVPFLAGAVAKPIADKMTEAKARALAELMLAGKQGQAIREAGNKTVEEVRKRLVAGLMAAGVTGGQQLSAPVFPK